MTAEIINLRKARKARTRDAEAARAEENRVRFGRTKAEKARDRDAQARLTTHVDGHRLEPDDKR